MYLARELKKLWIMSVKLIAIVVSAHGTVIIGLERSPEEMENREKIKTIQACKDPLEYSEKPRRHEDSWCHSESSVRPTAESAVTNSDESELLIKMTFCLYSPISCSCRIR